MRPTISLMCILASTLACVVGDDDGGSSFGTDPTTLGDGDGDGDPAETGSGDGDGTCGDGVVDSGEECDQGMANSASGTCTPACTIAECGDGYVLEGLEQCDDGNLQSTDACTAKCELATCGDGHVQAGVEDCDDGNDDETDGCTTACLPAVCGDNYVQTGEQCDDGNLDGTDECLPDCQLAYCGDGYVWAGMELCDGGGESADCDVDCTPPVCGDMLVNMTAGEECDDGNDDNYDDCIDTCVMPYCGDGFKHEGVEECDGDDFGESSCDDYGFNSGFLSCVDDCTIDSAECYIGMCPNGGAYVNDYCWYASDVCETTAVKCQSVGLTGSGGYVQTDWSMAVMDDIAMQLGLTSGGDAGCCVQFGWIENDTIYTHNFGPEFYNWDNCYSNNPTLKCCNPP